MYRYVEAALKLKNMTQGDLARLLNITPSTLSLKLNGKSPLTLNEAKEIKRVLEVEQPLDTLFEEAS